MNFKNASVALVLISVISACSTDRKSQRHQHEVPPADILIVETALEVVPADVQAEAEIVVAEVATETDEKIVEETAEEIVVAEPSKAPFVGTWTLDKASISFDLEGKAELVTAAGKKAAATTRQGTFKIAADNKLVITWEDGSELILNYSFVDADLVLSL